MIGVINYGLGNIQAFINVFQDHHIPAMPVSSAAEVRSVTKLILPGVGHFDYAMQRFNASGLRDAIEERVLTEKVPVLGVCVGMQMLSRGSVEGKEPGLAWINGEVLSLISGQNEVPCPHMGWNEVSPQSDSAILRGFEDQHPRFYFLHSYYFHCDEPERNLIATSDYGISFCAAVKQDHVYGVQFHPEKSHSFGARLLQNFAGIC